MSTTSSGPTEPTSATEQREGTEESVAGLWEAIDAEAVARDRALARAGQAMSLIGIVLVPLVWLKLDKGMGLSSLIVALASLSWFTVRRYASGTSVVERILRIVSPALILVFPFAVLFNIYRARGPELALGSWIPPELLIGFITFSMFRLRPALPLVYGLASAVFYLAFYLYIASVTPAAEKTSDFFNLSLHLIRAGTFALVGLTAAWATRSIRKTLGRASKRARANDLFGKYRLDKEIALGGMGSVWRATYCPEGGFERPVAVKRIHAHLAQNPRFVDSFRQEAELSARLMHPNIVSVLDFGRTSDGYFIAMEYVDGLSLAAIIDRCLVHGVEIPAPLIAQVGRQILDGLHFAHEVATDTDGRALHIVHRDLSPNNVLVGRAGQVKVVDFGIARALRESEQGQTQHVSGNFAYMSPEQAQGQPFDARSDLFAVGCLLWEMHCRQPLFLRSESAATLLAVIEGNIPPVAERRPHVGRGWDPFLQKALSLDPARRFQSASAMAAALDDVAAMEQLTEPDALRLFLRKVRKLKPPERVMSKNTFDAHDSATVPPGALEATKASSAPKDAPAARRKPSTPDPTRAESPPLEPLSDGPTVHSRPSPPAPVLATEEHAETLRMPAVVNEAATLQSGPRQGNAVAENETQLERGDTLIDPGP